MSVSASAEIQWHCSPHIQDSLSVRCCEYTLHHAVIAAIVFGSMSSATNHEGCLHVVAELEPWPDKASGPSMRLGDCSLLASL